jgi:DNA-binding NarL/FixJ family response regulator
MDLIIVDENIVYAKSLREFCLKLSNFRNVLVFRNLKELLNNYIPQRGILLFELNDLNTNLLNRFNPINSNLILVALTYPKQSELDFEDSFNSISSFISKSEKLNKILEQIVLIINGKRIIPQEIYEAMNVSVVKTTNKPTTKSLTNTITKLFL